MIIDMESTEVSNVPVNNRNECESNIGNDNNAIVIKDTKEDNIIDGKIEGKQFLYTSYSYHIIIYIFKIDSNHRNSLVET